VAIALTVAAGSVQAGPLHDAAGAGDVGEIRRLISEGADVDEIDWDGGMPLHAAALKGHLEAAEILIAEGASIDSPAGILGATPLHMAAIGGDRDLAALLVAGGADINARDAALNTPLHFAAEFGNLGVAELLIGLGADLNARDQDDGTPIDKAGLEGHFDIVDLLVARGFTAPPVEPITALMRDADPEVGRNVFTRCRQCHTIARDGADGRGPNLWGVLERDKAGSSSFDQYSGAFARLKGAWSYEELNAFLASPTDYAPGTTMSRLGLADPAERAAVIAYLRANGDEPPPLPE
jgi:cytochrome c